MNNTQTNILKLASLLTAAMLALPSLSAQSSGSDSQTATDSPNATAKAKGKHGHLEDVTTPAEKQELAKARKDALDQNPALQQGITAAEQAMKAAREEMKAAQDAVSSAMELVDPNVTVILEKIAAARKELEAALRKVESNPQLKAQEKQVRQLRVQLLEQVDPNLKPILDSNDPNQGSNN